MASSRLLLAATVAMAAIACSDFEHTNPFDPATPVAVRIVGPDTAYAFGDTLRFVIATDPVFPFPPAEWERHPAGLSRIGQEATYTEGTYVLIGGTDGTVLSVSATVGPRSASKTFVVMRAPVRLVAGDCSTLSHSVSAPVDRDIAICARMADRHGYLIAATPNVEPGVTIAVRDTPIAAVSSASGGIFRTRRVGTTSIVFTKGQLADTVTLTVTP